MQTDIHNVTTNQYRTWRRSWLVLMILVVILSSSIFYLYQLFSSATDNQRTAKIFEQSLLASINQYEYLPFLFTKDELVINLLENPHLDHTPLSDKLLLISQRSGANDLFLLDKSGTAIASSNYQQKGHNFYGNNYSFRPYFKKAISQRERQFYFAKGATTGISGFFISAPVIQNDKVLGVMVVKLELSGWENNWRESNENIVVADRNGVIILSSNMDWRYKTIGTLSDKTKRLISQQKQFLNESHLPLFSWARSLDMFNADDSFYWKIEGNAYLANRFQIQDTGWTLYYLVRHNTILTTALIFFLTIGLLSIALYLLLRERSKKLELRKMALLAEENRRHELQMLIDNIHIGVLVFSDSGRILSMNDHAEHLLLSGKEFNATNKPIRVNDLIDIDISADDFDSYLLEDIATPAYHETVALNQMSLQDIKNATPIMFAIGKVGLSDRHAYLMTVINITPRKMVENQLRQVNESLEETIEARTKELHETQSALMKKNKAVALGNMAATIVHELSQPLAAINSSVGAIQAKVAKENWQGANESVGRLLPLSNKMNNVIKLLKFFSYEDKPLLEDIPFTDIVKQAIDVLRDTLQEKNIRVEHTHEHSQILVRVNPIKIDLAVSNLLKNAIEAVEHNSNPLIIITTALEDDMIILHIVDNGGGVDERIMGQLLNPYFTTKEVGKGMGLGLSITYEIIQQYGGKISGFNAKQGAHFSISIPVLNCDASAQKLESNTII